MSIRSIDEYGPLKTRYSPWDVDLEFGAIDMVFRSPQQGLRIYKGGFTSQEFVNAFRGAYVLELMGEFRGVQCWQYEGNESGWLGIVDGRVIIAAADSRTPDARPVLDTVIDTLTGNHRPSLTQHPDLPAITRELDTDLNWKYSRTGHQAPFSGVRATGASYTITPDRVVRTRNIYAFESQLRPESIDIQAEVDRVIHDRLDESLVLYRDNLLFIEAATPLHAIISE